MQPTVVVCTRDRPIDLHRCLVSVLACRPNGCPVVVVDQSRGHDSAAVFAEVAGSAEGIEYLVSGRTGLSAARNQGAALAVTDLLLFTDDDCEITVDWVDSWRKFFEKNTTVGIGFGLVDVPEYDHRFGHIPGFDPGVAERVWGIEVFGWNREPSRRQMTGADCVGMGANMVVRRQAWAAVGGFDEALGAGAHFPAAEDLDLAYRIVRAGYSVGQTSRPTVVHHGYRDTDQASLLAKGYAAGIAAMYLKHLRCHDVRAAELMVRDGVRLAARVARAALTGLRPTGFNALRAYVRGIAEAKSYPLDVSRRLYADPTVIAAN